MPSNDNDEHEQDQQHGQQTQYQHQSDPQDQHDHPHHHQQQQQQQQEPPPPHEWIRGVNLGGWLLAERFITPYLFAVNSCHLQGSLCWYPGQMGAPTTDTDTAEHQTSNNSSNSSHSNDLLFCDPTVCAPIVTIQAKAPTDYKLLHPGNSKDGRGITKAGLDYPVDEYTLGQVLRSAGDGKGGDDGNHKKKDGNNNKSISIATKYMERHWETFVTYHDLHTLKEHGVTHLRIPMGYWIRGNLPGQTHQLNQTTDDDNKKESTTESTTTTTEEPYIPGGWPYFVRVCHWARKLKLTVWLDLHGAPGSENGFDNSGHYLGKSSCLNWSSSPTNVQRTLEILTDLATGVQDDAIEDVVTGFGILNEPFLDCDHEVLQQYYNNAFNVITSILGPETSVFVGDTFRPYKFNDGKFWTNATKYAHTYLDSHPYQVFFEQGRSFTPQQHIAYVCAHDTNNIGECCYEDGPVKNKIASRGISRIVGEWSGAYDALPTAKTPVLMTGIMNNGIVPELNRTLSKARKTFLSNFVRAQMVAYESTTVHPGISSGWLFWNFKMEGGAFIEWDFLRGLKEGWMPSIPAPTISSESLYGSCHSIYNRTPNNYSLIVDEYPNPNALDWNSWQGWGANDDFVMSDPTLHQNGLQSTHTNQRTWYDIRRFTHDDPQRRWFIPLVISVFVVGLLYKILRHPCCRYYFCRHWKDKREQYIALKV